MIEKLTKTHVGGGKPPKPVSEFGQVREGTVRYGILKRMSRVSDDGAISGDTVENISAEIGVTVPRVLQHAYHLWRDVGIGSAWGVTGI